MFTDSPALSVSPTTDVAANAERVRSEGIEAIVHCRPQHPAGHSERLLIKTRNVRASQLEPGQPWGFWRWRKTQRVQVPNHHILTRNLYYNYWYPKPKYLIVGYMDPLGKRCKETWRLDRRPAPLLKPHVSGEACVGSIGHYIPVSDEVKPRVTGMRPSSPKPWP